MVETQISELLTEGVFESQLRHRRTVQSSDRQEAARACPRLAGSLQYDEGNEPVALAQRWHARTCINSLREMELLALKTGHLR
jgi:hypothetical protein